MQRINWILQNKIKKDIKKLKITDFLSYKKVVKILNTKYYDELKTLYKYKVMKKEHKNQLKRCSLRITGKDRLVFEELKDGSIVKITLKVIQVKGHYDDH